MLLMSWYLVTGIEQKNWKQIRLSSIVKCIEHKNLQRNSNEHWMIIINQTHRSGIFLKNQKMEHWSLSLHQGFNQHISHIHCWPLNTFITPKKKSQKCIRFQYIMIEPPSHNQHFMWNNSYSTATHLGWKVCCAWVTLEPTEDAPTTFPWHLAVKATSYVDGSDLQWRNSPLIADNLLFSIFVTAFTLHTSGQDIWKSSAT